MSAAAADEPLKLHEALEAEHAYLHGGVPNPSPRNRCAHAALCLSGGGIRSASFALGVIQALGAKGLLRGFDYLSTVSGGGYAGGWLAGWLHNASLAPESVSVFEQLRGNLTPGSAVEPEPVAQVRANSRFLSPAAGFFSADMWTLVATIARNLHALEILFGREPADLEFAAGHAGLAVTFDLAAIIGERLAVDVTAAD